MTKTDYKNLLGKLLENYTNEYKKEYTIQAQGYSLTVDYDSINELENITQNKKERLLNKIDKKGRKQIKKLEKKLKTISPDFFDKESKSNDEILEHAQKTIRNLQLIEYTSTDDLIINYKTPYNKDQILLSARIEIKHASLLTKFKSLFTKNRHYYHKKLVKDFAGNIDNEKQKLSNKEPQKSDQHLNSSMLERNSPGAYKAMHGNQSEYQGYENGFSNQKMYN